MAKATRNEFVQFTGHIQSLAIDLSERAAKAGVNVVEAIALAVQPEGEKAREAIASILVRLVHAEKNIFRLTKKLGTTEELVAAGAYNYANPDVTSQNFPLRAKFMGEREIILLEFDREVSSEEAIAEAEKQGLERPVYEDALRFGAEHPEVQRERPIVFLHEPWRDPHSSLLVLSLWSLAGHRELRLYLFDFRWARSCRFAFVRKSK